MEGELIEHISRLLGSTVIKTSALSGGDISNAYCLNTKNERFLL